MAMPYYLTVLCNEHKANMTVRNARELRILAKALDFLAESRPRPRSAADVIAQRMKALDVFFAEGTGRRRLEKGGPVIGEAGRRRPSKRQRRVTRRILKWERRATARASQRQRRLDDHH